MKIAIVTHKVCKGDGQGRVNYEIVREALAQGHHLTLIATEVASEFQTHPAITWVSISVAHWPMVLLKNQVFAWKSAQWLKAHRREMDIVQVNGFITWAASDINAVHFVHSAWQKSPVHTAHSQRNIYGLYQWMYTALNARLERKAFSKAGTVVAVSETIRRELTAIGVPDERIRVIINGVDLQEFRPGAEIRDDLGLPDGVTVALFAGDLRTSRKNLDTVLQALILTPDLHLAIAGSTDGSPYPMLSKALGLSSRVHFLGHRSDMPALMRAADLFVFPSRYEPFGLVLLEALASGLPVVTAAAVGGASILTPACGIVLPDPNAVDTLAAALCTLAQDDERRQKMGVAARAVAEQHSWSHMAQAYLNVCRDAAAAHITPRRSTEELKV